MKIKLRDNITIEADKNTTSIEIKTEHGEAWITATVLEEIIKLNNKRKHDYFYANNKILEMLSYEVNKHGKRKQKN